MESLVSIILPVYNTEKYLKDCLESILNSTYKNFELIIVNDGSTDKSLDIIYSFSDKRIILVNKKNGGLSSARNAGLEIAKGEYITFIDSDDAISNNYLYYLVKYSKKYNADICFCNYMKVFNELPIEQNSYAKPICLSRNDFFCSNNYMNKVVSWGKLFKKKLLDNLCFKLNKIHEDEFFYNSLFLCDIHSIVYLENKLYFYRDNPNGIMRNIKTKHFINASQALLERLALFRSLGYNDALTLSFTMDFLFSFLYTKKWEGYIFKRLWYTRKLYFYKLVFNKFVKWKPYFCLLFIFFPSLSFLGYVIKQKQKRAF